MTPLTNIDDLALQFLRQIGYLPKGYDPKTQAMTVQESVPYRLFMDCFMRNIKRVWLVDEMAVYLETTRPTIYRHLNKLKGMDIIEELETERDGQMKKGYRIITASDPGNAIRLCEKKVEEIDLLITDVVMPSMNGKELYEKIKTLKPDIKVFYMSGYTADLITHRGVLAEGVHFIQKPFSPDELARRVREVLDRE